MALADVFGGFKRGVVIPAIIAGFLLVVANSAIWVNRNVFDTARFTSTAVGSLTSESSRQAIASEIVDKSLADYPRLKSVVDDKATNFISGLLGTEQVEKLLTELTTRAQVYVTSSHQESIVLDTQGLKDNVTKLIDITNREDKTRVDVNKIPDQIVLVDADKVPSFYKYGVIVSWLGPLVLLAAIFCIAWPYFKPANSKIGNLFAQGFIISLIAGFALLVGPLFKPPLLANILSVNNRTVVGNIYDAFIATFNQQTWVIIILGLLAMLTAAAYTVYQAVRKKS